MISLYIELFRTVLDLPDAIGKNGQCNESKHGCQKYYHKYPIINLPGKVIPAFNIAEEIVEKRRIIVLKTSI